MDTGPVFQSVLFIDSHFNPYKKVDHKAILLSIMKRDCENYLIKDYILHNKRITYGNHLLIVLQNRSLTDLANGCKFPL